MLGRLQLNRNFLIEYVINELEKGLTNFEIHNRYTPPCLVLASGPDFMVRANLWRATKDYERMDINTYGLAHDHNFDFLTINYLGPGYVSNMFLYDNNKVHGYIGEKVELINNGQLRLADGEMYLYRKSLDVHEQLPPIADSITINVMATLRSSASRNQYIFDTRRSEIIDVFGGFHRQEHVYAMALSLNNEECNDLMKSIALSTECGLTRSYLLSSLGIYF
jgi:hypothetical protein